MNRIALAVCPDREQDAAREVFSPKQLAERWAVSAKTVRRLISYGQLTPFMVGTLVRVPRSEVLKYEHRARSRKRAF